MYAFGLAMGVILAQSLGFDSNDLVKRLGSPSYAEREAALNSLERLGGEALPALQAAEGNNDPEVRERAALLRAKIEAKVLTRPTLVTLELKDRPLDEILAAISKRGLNRLDWLSTSREVRLRSLTLREPEPVPFWTAIDRFCESAALHYVPATRSKSVAIKEPQFRLFLSPGVESHYRSDDGPLRMELTSVYERRNIHLTPYSREELNGDSGVDPPPFYGENHAGVAIGLRLLVEPRLLIQRYGDAIITEAVDDRGQSLLREGEPQIHSWGISSHIPAQACISELVMRLQSPARPVRMIKRLRFKMPVEVVARGPKPLTLRLAGDEAKTARVGYTTVQVENPRQKDSLRVRHLELTLTSEERVPRFLALGTGLDVGRDPSETRPVRPEITANVLQIFDAEGRLFSGGNSPNIINERDGSLRVELRLEGRVPESFDEQAGPGIIRFGPGFMSAPAVLRYYEYKRAVVLAEFEFHDVAMP